MKVLGWGFENFKSFVGPHNLEISGFEPGLYFVRGTNEAEPRLGSNGSGKSSLFDALAWCLTGKASDGLKTTDLRPWKGKGETGVVLEVRNDNGKQTNLKRATDPNRLLLNGQAASQEDVDSKIIPSEVFFNTVLFGQGQPLFLDLRPAEKIALLNEALRLSKWMERSEKASAKAKELDLELNGRNGRLVGLNATRAEARDMLTKSKEKSDDWTSERGRMLKFMERELAEFEPVFENHKYRQATADLAYDSAETELRQLRRDNSQFATTLGDAKQKLWEAEARVRERDDLRGRLVKELETLETAKTCPTCGQAVKPSNLAAHRAELTNRLKASPVLKVPRNLVDEVKISQIVMERTQKDEQAFIVKVETAMRELNEINKLFSESSSKMSALRAKITEYQTEANPYRDVLQQLRRKVDSLGGEIKVLEKEIGKLSQLTERTRFWVKGFKDVCLYIVDEFLQELELESNAILPELGLMNWEIKYVVERETKSGSIHRGLDVVILSPHNRQPVKWEAWSGGEGQRLRIAVSLALAEALLNQTGVSINIQILDEPTRHLSGEGVSDICEFLSERAKRLGKVIFYVDHQSVESAYFAGVIEVIKGKTGSGFDVQS